MHSRVNIYHLNGILTLTLPKKETAQRKTIKIKAK